MIFTQADKSRIHGIINTDEHKDLITRLFAKVIISSTEITAPQIKRALFELESELTPKDETLKLTNNKNSAI